MNGSSPDFGSDGAREEPNEKSSDVPDQSDLPGLAAFAVMGTTCAACIAVGVLCGLWVDHLWHTSPWGLLLGIVLGAVVAVLGVAQQVRRYL